MSSLLTTAERNALLPPLSQSGWRAHPELDAIRKIWRFRSFSEAWAFMSRAALAAERANHHPDWTNRYNIVDVTLTTHSAKGLTSLDTSLAQKLDSFAPEAAIITDHGEPALCLCQSRA
ncbi:4a-hydroxytetrahydrobiopterin dehydratase [Xinfangfangia sp. D13-10-4-6]|uniref:4a-hydroxytetrahydrobiopterin dehydratase n=1 Tax=Pseudogemmobacter hezensis TaxID=2737662 RepID=UPI0015568C13|nr:4a-hydroxytetrahydrobiopterin dehydratase [Pseudogemmobacter hezensis]NPD16589.1 4a-hydroxytetrahydrobiopterin dehydratase [Pseudogemmobacter hezensis]